MKRSIAFTALVFAALASTPVHAGSNRAWVSGHGTDAAGCGAPSNPCRSFQYVLSSILNPGGEIDVLDPAGYGSMTIPFAVTILNGNGGFTAGVQASSGAAITIAAGASDAITLRGLTIEGLGTAATGIQFNSGGSLELSDSTVTGFTGVGVGFAPSGTQSSLSIKNSKIKGNAGANIFIGSLGTGLVGAGIFNSQIGGSSNGVTVAAPSGGTAGVAISNCNVGAGTATAISALQSGGGHAFVVVDRTVIFGAQNALGASGAEIDLNNSTISGIVGAAVVTTSGGVVKTYGNNAINAGGGVGPLTPTPLQ